MADSVNSVVLVGNLTRDPELRSTPSGTSVCSLRLAVNNREKSQGEWTDRANYFDVTVWGAQGENCANYLEKGRQVAVNGRLRFEEWEKDGQKRSAVKVVAQQVQFIGSRNGDGPVQRADDGFVSDVPGDTSDFEGAGNQTGGMDDDIPF